MANIRQIAELAGVSVATVSRALSNPAIVKDGTMARVRAAIEQLDYRPNAVASSLRRQRTDTIIVVVPNIGNPFFSGVIQGIEAVAHDNGYRVLLGETQNDLKRLDQYTELLLTKRADGLILLGSLLPTIVDRQRQAPPIPLVLACEWFEGLNCARVQIDNLAASALATSHLLERGKRRLATITGPLDNMLARDRLEGFRHATKLAGLTIGRQYVVEGDFSISSGYATMKTLLSMKTVPDGVVCANDEMALGALNAIREAGLRIPEDIALIGFDNIRFSEYSCPPLTTIAQPAAEIGEAAMHLMLGALRDSPADFGYTVLPHQLIVRQST